MLPLNDVMELSSAINCLLTEQVLKTLERFDLVRTEKHLKVAVLDNGLCAVLAINFFKLAVSLHDEIEEDAASARESYPLWEVRDYRKVSKLIEKEVDVTWQFLTRTSRGLEGEIIVDLRNDHRTDDVSRFQLVGNNNEDCGRLEGDF